MSQRCRGLRGRQGENRKFIHHQGPSRGDWTFGSICNNIILSHISLSVEVKFFFVLFFPRQPSSLTPWTLLPFIFWVTGESFLNCNSPAFQHSQIWSMGKFRTHMDTHFRRAKSVSHLTTQGTILPRLEGLNILVFNQYDVGCLWFLRSFQSGPSR